MGSSRLRFALLAAISFLVTAFGQGIWAPALGIVAGSFGIALFWHALQAITRSPQKFWVSVGWFFLVQSVQISWLASPHYMGLLILAVYALVCLGIALQFGLLSFLFFEREMTLWTALAAAGCWTWFEWLRTFFLTGFTWNPVGLALCSWPDSLQAASIFGIYGLSFWVIFINAMALWALRSRARLFQWIFLAFLPYAFGGLRQAWIAQQPLPKETISAAIVHTPFLPEQRENFRSSAHISPLSQWELIWEALEKSPTLDLIVFPESTVPLSAYQPHYSHFFVTHLWNMRFGDTAREAFPHLQSPFAVIDSRSYAAVWKVCNAFIAQSMANHFKAHIVAGFEDSGEGRAYNAAFHFSPGSSLPVRYEKRILVPVGEYIPFPKFEWLTQFLAKRFQISDSFSSGSQAKLFHLGIPAGISICLEETYSQAIRELRVKGAKFLINISNDVWFPNTQLPRVHLEHARIRCVENGVYAVRSCNKGISAVIDFKGNILAEIPASSAKVEAIFAKIPVAVLDTLYTFWGDFAILGISLICLMRSSFLSINSLLR